MRRPGPKGNLEDQTMLTRTTYEVTRSLIIGAIILGYLTPIGRLAGIEI